MSVVKAKALDSPAEFLEATLLLRNENPVLTNLLGSIATGVLNGRHYDECFWWVVEDRAKIVAAALRTAPHLVVLSPMDAAAAEVLATEMATSHPDFPGISGPSQSVQVFASASGFAYSPGMHELIYVLKELRVPNVPGRARPSNEGDRHLLPAWHRAFITEAGLLGEPDDDRIASMTANGDFLVWEVDGEVVSYAGHAPIVETSNERIGRVGPVYTPPQHRRRGYGAGVTAEVSRKLQRDGCTTVMLYTDAANPISNSIYQAIGYEQVYEWVELKRTS